jgi:hypothetical protein
MYFTLLLIANMDNSQNLKFTGGSTSRLVW